MFAGTILFHDDDPDLPWWRVVRADGSLAKGDRRRALLRAEGIPFRGRRVDMKRARVVPRSCKEPRTRDGGVNPQGQTTIKWKSASSFLPSLSRVWTSIAFWLTEEPFAWA